MNTADRLKSLVEYFGGAKSSHPIWQVWQEYLSVSPAQGHDEAIAACAIVLQEIRSLEAALKRMGVGEVAYRSTFETLRSCWSPTQLSANWSNFKDSVNRVGVVSVLAWASWAIRDKSENAVSDEILQSLTEKMAAQEVLLETVDMPPAIFEMLHRHIDELRRAIKFYKVTGIQPVVDIVHRQLGEVTTAPEDVVDELINSSPEAKNAFSKGIDIIVTAGKVADSGLKVAKFATEIKRISQSLWDAGKGLIEYFPRDIS
ncbi:hypothetical protein [Delftia sp. PE138]|uniref:hypothetical protein n=1 Tax=Delftia sp. PE138 TaxID=1812483 RepID=UPI001BAF4D35|nr:hypothetical protein [Delftia sp. PE138]MBS3723994.1 hypothetical protein [Delftia sp. PE138]